MDSEVIDVTGWSKCHLEMLNLVIKAVVDIVDTRKGEKRMDGRKKEIIEIDVTGWEQAEVDSLKAVIEAIVSTRNEWGEGSETAIEAREWGDESK